MFVLNGAVDAVPDFQGKHLWTAVLVYEVRDPIEFFAQTNGPVLFDYDNLILGPMLGCYHCSRRFDPTMMDQPCPGE